MKIPFEYLDGIFCVLLGRKAICKFFLEIQPLFLWRIYQGSPVEWAFMSDITYGLSYRKM